MKMEVKGAPQIGKENMYGFNGTEFNKEFELNVNTTFYRTYDPAIGRWWQADPLTELAVDLTPYNSNYNNPLIYVDPLGDKPDPYKKINRERRKARRAKRRADRKKRRQVRRQVRRDVRDRRRAYNARNKRNGNGLVSLFKHPSNILIPASKEVTEWWNFGNIGVPANTFGLGRPANFSIVVAGTGSDTRIYDPNPFSGAPRPRYLGTGGARVSDFPGGGRLRGFTAQVDGQDGSNWVRLRGRSGGFKNYGSLRLTITTLSDPQLNWSITVSVETKTRKRYFNGKGTPSPGTVKRPFFHRIWYGRNFR